MAVRQPDQKLNYIFLNHKENKKIKFLVLMTLNFLLVSRKKQPIFL